MNVIYDKETRRVIITEMNGIWTMPNNLDIKTCPLEADVFVDKDGDLYLKAEQVN